MCSKEAGEASYNQWGLDAGEHQDGWVPYLETPRDWDDGWTPLTHCRRELMQAVLAILFGSEFQIACQNGILVKCADMILRRLFPRIFTWSADYPEKYVPLVMMSAFVLNSL